MSISLFNDVGAPAGSILYVDESIIRRVSAALAMFHVNKLRRMPFADGIFIAILTSPHY